jgi:hypothetical protein
LISWRHGFPNSARPFPKLKIGPEQSWSHHSIRLRGKASDFEPCREGFHPLSTSTRKPEQVLVVSDETMGVNKLHKTLVEEGYSLSKKQVRALKLSLLKKRGEEATTTSKPLLIPILSERQPEKHRLLFSPKVLAHREKGNVAFKSGQFTEAELHYTAALRHKDNEEGDEEEGVPLWTLYGNRCAARLRLGRIDEAMQDSLASNMCAPADTLKPLLC